jgi:hypothetical protein
MFYKKRYKKIIVLIIYVDDIIITGNDEEGIQELEEKLFKEFFDEKIRWVKIFFWDRGN